MNKKSSLNFANVMASIGLIATIFLSSSTWYNWFAIAENWAKIICVLSIIAFFAIIILWIYVSVVKKFIDEFRQMKNEIQELKKDSIDFKQNFNSLEIPGKRWIYLNVPEEDVSDKLIWPTV